MKLEKIFRRQVSYLPPVFLLGMKDCVVELIFWKTGLGTDGTDSILAGETGGYLGLHLRDQLIQRWCFGSLWGCTGKDEDILAARVGGLI